MDVVEGVNVDFQISPLAGDGFSFTFTNTTTIDGQGFWKTPTADCRFKFSPVNLPTYNGLPVFLDAKIGNADHPVDVSADQLSDVIFNPKYAYDGEGYYVTLEVFLNGKVYSKSMLWKNNEFSVVDTPLIHQRGKKRSRREVLR